jgi:hypothetical protein
MRQASPIYHSSTPKKDTRQFDGVKLLSVYERTFPSIKIM